MNKFAIVIALTILWGCAAAAGPVAIAPAGGPVPTVQARDFVTLPFEISNRDFKAHTLHVTWTADPGVSLISIVDPVTVQPGQAQKLTLTFSVSVADPQVSQLAIRVAVTSSDSPDTTAEARVDLAVDHVSCARIRDMPERVHMASGRAMEIPFSVENCGPAGASFDVEIVPGPGLAADPVSGTGQVAPRGARRVSASATPADRNQEYETWLRVRVSDHGATLDEYTLEIIVPQAYVPEIRRNAQSAIALRVTVDRLFRSSNGSSTALRLSMPAFAARGATLSSDVRMDSRGGKFETRRRRYDLGLGKTLLVAGDQQAGFSTLLQNGGRSYEGWSLSTPAAGGRVSVFRGNRGATDATLIEWRQSLGSGVDLAVGHMAEQHNAAARDHLAATVARASIRPDKFTTFDLEAAQATLASGAGRPARSGTAYRAAGSYQTRRFQFSASFQDGHKDFAAISYLKGFSLRAQLDTGNERRFFLDFRNQISYQPLDLANGAVEFVPYRRQTRSVGYSQPVIGGVLLFASLNANTGDARSAADPLHPLAMRESFFLLKLSRDVHGLAASAGLESGRRTRPGGAYSYRNTSLAVSYRKNGVLLNFDRSQSVHLSDRALESYLVGKTSYGIGYTLPDKDTSIHLGWSQYLQREADGGSQRDKRFTARLDARVSEDNVLGLSYEILRSRGGAERTVWGTFSRTLDLPLPYRNTGDVRGRIYRDVNRNAVFDEGDEPVARALVRLAGWGETLTDEQGQYSFPDVAPGDYDLAPDNSSYPVGLKPQHEDARVTVRAGKDETRDFALQIVNRYAGRVSVLSGDYFTDRAGLSPAQLRVLLVRDGMTIRDTFTNAKGEYAFDNVVPGAYAIMLDTDWMPGRMAVAGADTCPAAPDAACDFTVGLKQKKLITTYQEQAE